MAWYLVKHSDNVCNVETEDGCEYEGSGRGLF
jgi:hypothetical protein